MNNASGSVSLNQPKLALYAAVGPSLTRYTLDMATGRLSPSEAVRLPENVQYAWPHVSRRYLYVASSSTVPGGEPRADDKHSLTAFAVDPATGVLTPHGASLSLPGRPIHISTDKQSRHVLIAFNNPAGLRVYAVRQDATLDRDVTPLNGVEVGFYPHQVLVTPDDQHVILVERGSDAEHGRAEDPGSLRVFRFKQGSLEPQQVVAPAGGFGFGPRHLDFHPSRPWVYVSIERQNRLDMFEISKNALGDVPLYQHTTLACPEQLFPGQAVGTVRVHPGGRFVYVANRASATKTVDGAKVFAGGENSIAVFAIDPATGEPTSIQHADTRGIHCRNFQIDPTGSLLVASHITGLTVRGDDGTHFVPGRLSVFRIGENGQLTFLHAQDVELAGETMFWMGMLALPAPN